MRRTSASARAYAQRRHLPWNWFGWISVFGLPYGISINFFYLSCYSLYLHTFFYSRRFFLLSHHIHLFILFTENQQKRQFGETCSHKQITSIFIWNDRNFVLSSFCQKTKCIFGKNFDRFVFWTYDDRSFGANVLYKKAIWTNNVINYYVII